MDIANQTKTFNEKLVHANLKNDIKSHQNCLHISTLHKTHCENIKIIFQYALVIRGTLFTPITHERPSFLFALNSNGMHPLRFVEYLLMQHKFAYLDIIIISD